MRTTQIPNLVSYLLGLFDTLVLLVAWPSGKKGCKGVDFTQVTLKDMADPEYRRKLAEGNIGVVQGEASGGIGSIDIDDDQGAEEFLALNPDLKETLRSRGARGCNVWFYPEGDHVPASCNLKRNGKAWGEWRFNGRQTILAGVHPSGVPYTLLCASKAIRYPFDKIKFPLGVTARFIHPTPALVPASITPDQQTATEQQTHRPQSVVLCNPLCPSVHSGEGNGGLDTETMETLLAGTIPTGEEQSLGARVQAQPGAHLLQVALQPEDGPLAHGHHAVFLPLPWRTWSVRRSVLRSESSSRQSSVRPAGRPRRGWPGAFRPRPGRALPGAGASRAGAVQVRWPGCAG
jgi:hypothetical protein